jgi:hypothetical protein
VSYDIECTQQLAEHVPENQRPLQPTKPVVAEPGSNQVARKRTRVVELSSPNPGLHKNAATVSDSTPGAPSSVPGDPVSALYNYCAKQGLQVNVIEHLLDATAGIWQVTVHVGSAYVTEADVGKKIAKRAACLAAARLLGMTL